jgi:hypothetical protein
MTTLAEKAREFGGTIQPNGSIRVPADKLTQFLDGARSAGLPVPYIECLFVSDKGTRPSMMLSAEGDEFPDHTQLMAFASDAAARAIAEADADSSTAFFEVGP